MLEEILSNQTLTACIIFITQILVIGVRTINVIYTAKKEIWPSIASGMFVSTLWIVSLSLGTNSVLKGQVFPIIMFVLGGAIGTYIGFKLEQKLKR